MAYLRTEEEEDQLRQQQEEQARLGNGSSVVSAGGAPSPATLRSPGAPGGASTVDVNAYLKANRPQAEQLGENVAKGYEDERTALGADVAKAEKDALDQISTGRIDYDQGFVDKALADPSSLVKDPAAMDRFNKMKTGGAAVTAGIPNYDELASRVTKAKEKGALADTAGGQKELIRGIAPQTTAGGRELDAMLLGQTPGAINRVKEAAGRFGDVETNLQAARTKTTDAATAAQNSADMAKERLDAAFKTGTANFAKGVQDRFTSTRDAAVSRAQALKGKVGAPDDAWINSLSEADLADLDVSRGDLKYLSDTAATSSRSAAIVKAAQEAATKRGYDWSRTGVPGLNFNSYLESQRTPLDFSQFASNLDPLELPGVDAFASADDYAAAAALRSLGYDPGVLGGEAPTSPADFDALNFDAAGARGSADNRLKTSDDMLVDHFRAMFGGPNYQSGPGLEFVRKMAAGGPTLYNDLGPEMEEFQREAVRAAARRGIISL